MIESVDYRNVFSDDYSNAIDFMEQNSELFLEFSNANNTDAEVIIAVLFPEAIRYSIISDYLETKSLELAYVYGGLADFSIGFFQMKPSFVENLESSIKQYPKQLAKYDSLLISDKITLADIRKTRVERLQTINYQVAYANCFYDVVRILYPHVFKNDKTFQIKFISTAFNHGFLSGEKEILDYTTKAFFPLGGKNNTSRYNYSDISVFFYKNDLQRIVSENE